VPHAVVSAMGPDRPGIVARVTRVLLEHGCNVADSHMGLLSGRFTMMLVVEVPAGVDEERFLADLEEAGGDLGLDAVYAHYVRDSEPPATPTHLVTVYGADHPGIVHAVAAALAERGATITDLQTRLAAELYVMTLEVAGDADIEGALAAVSAAENVEVTVRPLEPDVL